MINKKDITVPIKTAIQNYIPYLTAVLTPFLSVNPGWEAIFYSAIGLYGIYMACNQEEVNEIVEFIKSNPEKFNETIVNSKEFKKAFLLFMEQYMKERLEKKKGILKNIILGYCVIENKNKYDLERLNDSLVRITLPSLDFLLFLKTQIIPQLKSKINKELEQDYYQKSDRSIEWWEMQLMTTKSIWELIDKWLNDEFSPNTIKVKQEYGIKNNEGWISDLQHRAETREKEKRSNIYDCISELVSLGVFDIKVAGGTFGGGAAKDYSLTTFGVRFINIIDES